MTFQCQVCRWEGMVPNWSDNTPLEVLPNGERAQQSAIPTCPDCGGTCRIKVSATCTSI